jgi:hypothetical protein
VAAEICKGSCNSGFRKARALYDEEMRKHAIIAELRADGGLVPDPPDPPDIQPWLGDPVWCVRCRTVIHKELAELDYLASMLAALPPGIQPVITGQREHVKVSGTREHESPSRGVEELDDLAGWARQWESDARVKRIHEPGWDVAVGADPVARHGYLADEITESLDWLVAHFPRLIDHPDRGITFGAEVRQWHRLLTGMAHAARATKHVKQPCPRCCLYTLWEDLGKDYIRCINEDCNRRLTRAELAEAERDTALAS